MIKTLKQTVQRTVTTDLRIGDVTILTCSFENAIEADTIGIDMSAGDNVIDWGDGEVDTFTVKKRSPKTKFHTYDKEFIDIHKNMTFNIIIDGDILNFAGPTYGMSIKGFRSLIIGVYPLSKKQTSALRLFENCKNLKHIPNNMFKYCNIEDFRACFRGTQIEAVPKNLFDTVPDNANFDSTFEACRCLVSSDLQFNGATAQSLRHFNEMFARCTNLKTINPDMFKHVSNTADVSSCFAYCENLNIPGTLLDSIPDCDVKWMFRNALNSSNVNNVPQTLFSKFSDSRLKDLLGYEIPFAIDDADICTDVKNTAKNNKIKMQVGSKNVGLYRLIAGPYGY